MAASIENRHHQQQSGKQREIISGISGSIISISA